MSEENNDKSREILPGVALGALEDETQHKISDGRAKMTFFDAIGLTDERPYVNLTASDAINKIREGAGITWSEVGRQMGLSRERPRQLMQKVASIGTEKLPDAAEALGNALKALLQQKLQEGVIRPDNFLPKSERKLKRQAELKASLLSQMGLPKADSHYLEYSPNKLVRHFCNIVLKNLGVTAEETARQLDPEYPRRFIGMISGSVAPDEHFIRVFAAFIKPYIKGGIDEGWLDAKTGAERPFEAILSEKLPELAGKIAGHKGLDALSLSIDESGVARTMLSLKLGHESNWLSRYQPEANAYFPSKGVHDIADAIAPYVRGEKRWNGTLEVTDPEDVKRHVLLKEYLVNKMEEAAGEPLPELREMAGRHPSVGTFAREIRQKLGLSQYDTLSLQMMVSRIELNSFPADCIDGQGVIASETYKAAFKDIASTLGKAWKNRRLPAADENTKNFADRIKPREGREL